MTSWMATTAAIPPSSACAKFTTRFALKIKTRPTAVKAYSDPNTAPRTMIPTGRRRSSVLSSRYQRPTAAAPSAARRSHSGSCPHKTSALVRTRSAARARGPLPGSPRLLITESRVYVGRPAEGEPGVVDDSADDLGGRKQLVDQPGPLSTRHRAEVGIAVPPRQDAHLRAVAERRRGGPAPLPGGPSPPPSVC